MPLPRCLLDTLLFLGMVCRVLDALLPSLLLVLLFILVLLLGMLLRLLLVLVLLLGMLLRLLFVLVLLLGMLLWLLFVLVLLLGMLLWLLFVLVLLLGMLLRLLLILLLLLGMLLWLLLLCSDLACPCPCCANAGTAVPRDRNMTAVPRVTSAFICVASTARVGVRARNSCILLTGGNISLLRRRWTAAHDS